MASSMESHRCLHYIAVFCSFTVCGDVAVYTMVAAVVCLLVFATLPSSPYILVAEIVGNAYCCFVNAILL